MTLSNNDIKKIRSLQQKKFRDQLGLFVVEGEKMVDEAVRSGFKVENIYNRDEIGIEAMKKISSLQSPSPILAVVHKPEDVVLDMADCQTYKPSNGLYLGLDTMRDPGNLGTVLRIADWFGIDAIYVTHDTVDVFNPKVVQATMGAIFRVKFHYCELPILSKNFIESGGSVYGTFLDGENMYTKDLNTGEDSPVMIVIGNESEGISANMEKIVNERLYIPPYPSNSPGSESLNAAVATAITIAEFRRKFSL